MLDLYDQNGWIGIVARGEACNDLFDLPSTRKFMNQGYADQELIDQMIDELDGETSLALVTLRALLQEATTPPVLIATNASDPRLEKFDPPDDQPSSEDEYAWAGVENILAGD